MTKIVCDRCGAEITVTIFGELCRHRIEDKRAIWPRHIELCGSCYAEFCEWMRNEVDFVTSEEVEDEETDGGDDDG